MATVDQDAGPSFRLSWLIYDTRYRSMTIQILVLFGFMTGAVWLVNNMLENLALQGKDLGFDFLAAEAGFEIEPQLVEYSSKSSNFMAAVVGMLNTLMVAAVGCFIATILGVAIGVARLSHNLLLSRFTEAYVEVFRNVPVLLWILFGIAIMSEVFPQPRDFRGADATASMLFVDTVAITNRGFYVPAPVFESGSAIVVVTFLLSLVGIWLFGKWSLRRQEETGNIRPNFWIKIGILIVPVALVFLIMGRPIALNYPELKGFNFRGGLHLRAPFIALTLALALYTSAFIAEAVRAGIQAIDKGQTEAAAALGLRPRRAMRLVILPQALRVIIPPLISQYLNLTKNSSLALAVGYIEITGTLGGTILNQTGREMECILLLMAVYLTISLAISAVMNLYNNSIKLKER